MTYKVNANEMKFYLLYQMSDISNNGVARVGGGRRVGGRVLWVFYHPYAQALWQL